MLFNKDGNGSAELQELTGNFAASNDYSAVVPFVYDAAETVSGIVGAAVVQRAEAEYESGETTPLCDAVRLPVALLATISHTRANFLSHEDSGARLKADTNEKIPFEWMVDRDEAAQRDRYYKALDALFRYLDANDIPEWTESEAAAAVRRSLITSLRQFETVYPLDGSNYTYMLLQQLVVEAQSSKLRRLIGAARLAELMAAAQSGDPGTPGSLLDLCRRYLALYAIVTAVRRWSVEIFPRSIARRFHPTYQGDRASKAATQAEMDRYVEALADQIAEAEDLIAEEVSGSGAWDGYDPLPRNDPRDKFFTAQ